MNRVVLLALVCTVGQLNAQGITQQLRESRDRLMQIRTERGQLETDLSMLQTRARDLRGEIGNIERQKDATNRIVNEIDNQISKIVAEIDTITFDLILAEDALAEKNAILDWRLAEVYKRGPLWGFQVLLAAESFGDLISRYKYLYLASRQDRALVEEVTDLRDRITDQREQLMTLRRATERSRDDRSDELQRFVDLERQRQRALNSLRSTQRLTTGQIEQLEQSESQLNDLIARLERARRESASRTEFSGPVGVTDASIGTLPWPVEGTVIFGYGSRVVEGVRVTSNGIGIQVPVGTSVKAVARGQVVFADGINLDGPTVIIDHGGGFLTLYMQLSEFRVAVGEMVEGGDIVGLSGGGGSREGAHIQFQIRGANGTMTYDPASWLRPLPRRR